MGGTNRRQGGRSKEGVRTLVIRFFERTHFGTRARARARAPIPAMRARAGTYVRPSGRRWTAGTAGMRPIPVLALGLGRAIRVAPPPGTFPMDISIRFYLLRREPVLGALAVCAAIKKSIPFFPRVSELQPGWHTAATRTRRRDGVGIFSCHSEIALANAFFTVMTDAIPVQGTARTKGPIGTKK